MKALEKAIAVWHLADTIGNEAFPFELGVIGDVQFSELEGEEKSESLRRGGDGHTADFNGQGYFALNRYRARKLRSENGKISLYIRVKPSENAAGGLFFSENLALSLTGNGLILAHLGVKTRGGKTFRVLPLCFMSEVGETKWFGEWLDLVLTVGNGEIIFYVNGVRRGIFPLNQEICAPFDEDMVIGAFKSSKPDTYGSGLYSDCISCAKIDTVATWHDVLSEDDAAQLCGVEKIEKPMLDSIRDQVCRLQNAFFDASVEGSEQKCREISSEFYKLSALDKRRPTYHLTNPNGTIFDPCGAFYHGGRYHVFSYHCTGLYLLDYSSLDHYVSEDLVHWEMMPIAPFADSDYDMFCIYLLNHFYDDDGNLYTLYTGQGKGGKCGVLAKTEDMINYTDKHPVLTDYHHDGHVFRHGGKWYTITSRMVKGRRAGDLGDPVMMWTSDDLENWTEIGEIFTARKTEHDPKGFMEFPYLLPFGEKYVLMMGTRPVMYWVGQFDWDKKKFIPDHENGLRLDYTNPFPCFNPLCVDNKGEGGSPRRLIMVLACLLGCNTDSPTLWSLAHAQPRVLSLENFYLRQDPIPELAVLRHSEAVWRDIATTPDGEILTSGDCIEIEARFNPTSSGRFGVKLYGNGSEHGVSIWFNGETRQFGVAGDVYSAGEGPSYVSPEEPICMRIFIDKQLIEVFVNGQSCTTASDEHIGNTVGVFGDGNICTSFTAWQMGE